MTGQRNRCQLSRPHTGLVVSELLKPGSGPALIEPPGILDWARLDRLARDGELGAIELRVPGVDPDSVLQVSQVRRGSLALGDRRAQGVQECALLDRVLVSVLGQEPRRLGCLVTDEWPSWPSPAGDQVSQPPGVVVIDALPLLAEAVREPASVRIGLRGGQVADPLIFLAPGQQLLPEFLIHQAIAPECHLRRKAHSQAGSLSPAAGMMGHDE
jgi:hypothetical protein